MNTAWQFETKHFRVALEIHPEEMSPDFDCPEDIEAIRNGDVEWFCAIVSVYYKGHRIACDSLGGCAYKTVQEFYTAHRDADPMNRNSSIMRAAHGDNISICHYFPSMVSEAIREARKVLCDMPKMRCA